MFLAMPRRVGFWIYSTLVATPMHFLQTRFKSACHSAKGTNDCWEELFWYIPAFLTSLAKVLALNDLVVIMICALLVMLHSSGQSAKVSSWPWRSISAFDGPRSSQEVTASEKRNLLPFLNLFVARKLTYAYLNTLLDESKCSHLN